ncbi:MAG: thioredoxin [Lachnospiraceae bacterium]|nr:thioredoxin [Lachnospiraceae bacterium]
MAALHLQAADFDKEVLEADKPVLIDFFATWCGPCKQLSPVIDEIADEQSDIKVVKIDVDQCQELAEQFSVMSIPTLVAMKDGREIKRQVGGVPKAAILDLFA